MVANIGSAKVAYDNSKWKELSN